MGLQQRKKSTRYTAPKGFTLVEVLVTSVLMGIGITSMMAGISSSNQVNSAGSDISQAVLLMQDVREWTMNLPFRDPDIGDAGNGPGSDGISPQEFVDDLDDLMDVTFSPPKNSHGETLYEMSDWSETITLTWRSLSNVSQAVTDGSTTVINVQVTIQHQGQDVMTSSWLRTEAPASQ